MIQTTAIITKWKKATAANSDGSTAYTDAFDHTAPGAAIRCAVDEPSNALRSTLAAEGVEHARVLRLEDARLARRGIVAEAGDVLAIKTLARGGIVGGQEERWYRVVRVIAPGSAGAVGAISSLRMEISPAGAVE